MKTLKMTEVRFMKLRALQGWCGVHLVVIPDFFSRDIREQKKLLHSVIFISPFLTSSLVLFLKYQHSTNVWRKALNALLLLWVNKEKWSGWMSRMNVSVSFWLLTTLLHLECVRFVNSAYAERVCCFSSLIKCTAALTIHVSSSFFPA